MSSLPRQGPISTFIERHFRHFNAATLNDAALAYRSHLDAGGSMMLAMAGAMSTAELGVSLAEMIRQGKIHAICCTGANLEEDVFNLVARSHYERLPKYRDLTPQDEQALLDRHLNRVTDTCIPEHEAMRRIENIVLEEWRAADSKGERLFPHEFLYRCCARASSTSYYEIDPADTWLIAASDVNLPIFVPGWEDSTLGNIFAAHCIQGTLKNVHTVRSGIEYMMTLASVVPVATAPRARSASSRSAAASPAIFRSASCRCSARISGSRRPALGLLLPDQRLDDELRVVFGRRPEREDHLGQARHRHTEVHHRVRRDDRRAARLRPRPELVVADYRIVLHGTRISPISRISGAARRRSRASA